MAETLVAQGLSPLNASRHFRLFLVLLWSRATADRADFGRPWIPGTAFNGCLCITNGWYGIREVCSSGTPECCGA